MGRNSWNKARMENYEAGQWVHRGSRHHPVSIFCIFEISYETFSFTCVYNNYYERIKNVFLNIRKVLTYQCKFINSPWGHIYYSIARCPTWLFASNVWNIGVKFWVPSWRSSKRCSGISHWMCDPQARICQKLYCTVYVCHGWIALRSMKTYVSWWEKPTDII